MGFEMGLTAEERERYNFQCGVCKKNFITPTTLRQHKKRKHEGKNGL